MQANEKKRPKEERDIAQRLRPLAKLQTAEDYEEFVEGIICTCIWTVGHQLFSLSFPTVESVLRKRITELQHYRRMGVTTPAEVDKYESDVMKRVRSILLLLRCIWNADSPLVDSS